MWKTETPLTCSRCQRQIRRLDDVGVCIMCHHVFCRRHLVIRGGVANCAACEEIRAQREQSGPVSQVQADRVARLLERDLLATVGRGYEAAVEETVSRIRLFADDPTDFERRVVDLVQQFLHDTFIDTSWPACPDHPNHPLWYSDGWWMCERSGRRAAPLGGLPRQS